MSTALGTGGLTAEAAVQDRVCLAAGPKDHADWGIRTVHFRDPDGNLIEVNHVLPAQ